MYEVTKDRYEISVWEDVLQEAEEQQYIPAADDTPENEVFYKLDEENNVYVKLNKDEEYNGIKFVRVPRKLSYFKEEKVAVIGANDHNAPELAYNPRFVDEVNGEHTLTFTMNSKYFDKELETFVDNPYTKLLTNEKKVKLFFRDEWYDLIIKKVEESKQNYAYVYTATDLFINELGKNGFKVELDTELENNQGTATELASQILEDTDWKVSTPFDEGEGYKSDLLVETNLDTLYKAYLCKDILVKVSADGWLPIREEDVEKPFTPGKDDKDTQIIKKGEQIYLFYSDLIAKNPEPMILYRADGNYEVNENEDIIINSYNFRVTRENKVTYRDTDVPMPDFIVYDEYMPVEYGISSDATKYFFKINEEDKTIDFVTEEPTDYKGKIYQKQDSGKFGLILEDGFRAYETIRRAETGYDPVTDEFVTYFLKRLYTKDFVLTEDTIPYSNKEYFTREKLAEGSTQQGENIRDGYKYTRYYGYTFDGRDFYEQKYNEFLKDGQPLDDNTQYYVKSQVPEYIPTVDDDVNYYLATRYKNGVQYFYFNEVIRQYMEVYFNDAEEFDNFGKKIYYREDKKYYLYDETENEYRAYGNFDVYTKADQIFNLGTSDGSYKTFEMVKTEDTSQQPGKQYYQLSTKNNSNYQQNGKYYIVYNGEEFVKGEIYYELIEKSKTVTTLLALPENLSYYVLQGKREWIDLAEAKKTYIMVDKQEIAKGPVSGETYYIYNSNNETYEKIEIQNNTFDNNITYFIRIININVDEKYRKYDQATSKYSVVTGEVLSKLYPKGYKLRDQDFTEVDKRNNFDKEATYYIKDSSGNYEAIGKGEITEFDANTTYYLRTGPIYYKLQIGEGEKFYQRIEDFDLIDRDKLYYHNDSEEAYYLHSLSTRLPVYNQRFVYEQTGKMIDGYIKYEASVWSRLKGYTETEYLSPTLVQNFLSNSMEISSLDAGWLFDGAPTSEDRAGELTNRLDDPTLPDPDEDPTSSLLILHLTDTPVYYASQTGEYLYTSYDFVVSNPMITDEEFHKDIAQFYEKELVHFDGTNNTPKREYKKIEGEDIEQVFKENYLDTIVYSVIEKSGYYIVDRKLGKEFLQPADNTHAQSWLPQGNNLSYYYNAGDAYKFYCIKSGDGLYKSINKVYATTSDNTTPIQILHYPEESDPNINNYQFWKYDAGIFKSLDYIEANRYVRGAIYYKKSGNTYDYVGEFKNQWQFFAYDEQLYFKSILNKEQFYAVVGYEENTPIYGFKPTNDTFVERNKAYYKIRTDLSKVNSSKNIWFESTNNFKFEDGVNQYFTYNIDTDTYEKVSSGATAKEGIVYYEFKPTGKMHYLPYDYYRDAWESAAIRDYLDNMFPSPGYQAYVPFIPIITGEAKTGGKYYAKKTDGTYKELDDYALRNYMGDYVYEKWDDDAIAELQAIFNFEYTEDGLTQYAKDLLSLVSDLLDWADYQQESKIEFLNAIDLFGIKRAILLSKLRRLEKNYPDVEQYQRDDLLKYLELTRTELNQQLRMEMSVLADPQVVNYIPTKDITRKAGKKYYCFRKPSHGDGEVSRSYMAYEYTGETFYRALIDEEEFVIRPINTESGESVEHDLHSLIIYEFDGQLPELLDLINDALGEVKDQNKSETLNSVKSDLEQIRFESSWTLLNPLKVYKAYQALLRIRGWLKDGSLVPDDKDDKVYQTILDFYQLFFAGNNKADELIWRTLGFLSNDAIPFYIQSIFSRAKIEYGIMETIEAIDKWLENYQYGEGITYINYISYTGAEIKKILEDGDVKSVTVLYPKDTYKCEDGKDENGNPIKICTSTNYQTIIDGQINLNGFDQLTFTKGSYINDMDIYYLVEIEENPAEIRFRNLSDSLKEYSFGHYTYVKVDINNETPNPNEKYYIKNMILEDATDQTVNSIKRYFIMENGFYKEVTDEMQKHITQGVINSGVYVFIKYSYLELTEELTSWKEYQDILGNQSREYYRKQETFIDYSDNIVFNTNLEKAIKNLEEVISLRFDDANELKTGNKVFDDVVDAITGFTIIWHLEKEEREQAVAGTKLLIALAKKLTALQISDDFIDFCLDRRYEGHKRRALNTGFAANRNVIKKFNKGEEYVLALSLGRYYEGEEPPAYTKKGSFTYGDIENKYYYFDHNPIGIGDYVMGVDDYKEIFQGEPNYNTPYGWMEAEGRFELATIDDTIAPLFVCIAQEIAKDKFVTRFVKADSSEITRSFYYEEPEGEYICVRTLGGLFQFSKSFEKANNYKWLNGKFDQVLLKNNKWRVLYNSRKEEAKRFRKSPTYICLKPDESAPKQDNIQYASFVTYDRVGNTYIMIDEQERIKGPIQGETYYVYNRDTNAYEKVELQDNTFDEDVAYFRYVKAESDGNQRSDIQYFRRSTDNQFEGKYKLDRVNTINDISTDGDFYKILTVSELAMGPQRDTVYYTYDDTDKVFKKVKEGLEVFEEGVDYYYSTYDRDHFSLYTSDDVIPDLYCFVPDNHGDYVHIIRKEEVEEVNVKWYQFWLRSENMNKIYREFKDTDDLSTDAPHYFKRYNSAMDYDYHNTSWKDGHIGPWREKYQRYSKFQVHLYDNTELDEAYTYWVSNPFSDGSECYTLYTYEQPKRYTMHKRYLGYENGVHKYLTKEEIITQSDDQLGKDTNHPNVNDVTFTPPENYKNYTNETTESTGSFKLDLGVKLVPVKIDTRMFRPFENETDTQRVPYIMLKSKENFQPTAGVDWIYCQSANASDAGYYRECTVDDTNAYANWQIAEGVDQLLGLYKFLKVKDPINWNSDNPPFTFATPVEVSMLSHQYAMEVIKSLNTPYWWGRTRYASITSYIRTENSFETFLNFCRDFWNWGDSVSASIGPISNKIWRYFTNASSADEFVHIGELTQDAIDAFFEKIAAAIRNIMNALDFSKDNKYATAILNWIDNNGIDINSDDPDFLLVTYPTPIAGMNYYTKEKVDGKWVYVLWNPSGSEGTREFDSNRDYFVLEAEQEKAIATSTFTDLDNSTIGVIKYSPGSPTLTYHYYPTEKSSYFTPVEYKTIKDEAGKDKLVWYYKGTEKEVENPRLCYINARLVKSANKQNNKWYIDGTEVTEHQAIRSIKLDKLEGKENKTFGAFLEVQKEESIDSNRQYYVMTSEDIDGTQIDTSNQLTPDARLNFWDAMYGLYGSQWSNLCERDVFGTGNTYFLNTEKYFTEDVLNEIYSFTELWVKEVHNGVAKMIPFDSVLHDAKQKYYRHTYSGLLKDAVDGLSEVYYSDGGVYKYYATRNNYDSVIPINYDGLKVSFCEYDYESSIFRISPTQTDNSYEANLDYSGHHKTYLDFDCSNPIEGYFDITISPEIQEDIEGNLITPAIKERYVWWKAPVLNNYNLTEDLYSRVGTLFYTDSKSMKSYPIVSAQLFKYKTYKSNNLEVLTKFKKQFSEYEITYKDSTSNGDTYEPTFEEYKELKEAFQGYFGIDEWNKVEEQMDIRYDGKQRKFDIYESYLNMLNSYLNEDGNRVNFLKDRIIWNPATGQYSFKFKNRRPMSIVDKISKDVVKIKLSYYDQNDENSMTIDKNTGAIKWINPDKVVDYSGVGNLNEYEKQEANRDLQIPLANFDSIDLNRFNTLIKNLMYKYGMYKVSSEERGDPNDIYYGVEEIYTYFETKDTTPQEGTTYYTINSDNKTYTQFTGTSFVEGVKYYVRNPKPTYDLKTYDGFSTLPSGDIYHARALSRLEIQEPFYQYDCYSYEQLSKDFNNNLKNSDYYYFGFNAITNPDTMFKFEQKPELNEKTYYKKVKGVWIKASELIVQYKETTDKTPDISKKYYTKNDNGKYILFNGNSFEQGKTYYEWDEYEITNDKKPNEFKNYYVKNGEDYVLFKGETFEQGKTYYEKKGLLGNISYYTWDNSLVYYKQNCSYVKVKTDEKEEEYDYKKSYYVHENMSDWLNRPEFDEKAKTYGKLYQFDDNYEILNDINEASFNDLIAGTKPIHKRTSSKKELSYQQSITKFNYDPNTVFIKYWYPLIDVNSQTQLEKYIKDSVLTGEAPNGIYVYDDLAPRQLRGGSTFYIKSGEGYNKVTGEYNQEERYYFESNGSYREIPAEEMYNNYTIFEPYKELKAGEKYQTEKNYWTYVYLNPQKNNGYINNIRYFASVFEYVPVQSGEVYDSNTIYCRDIADNKLEYGYFYTRDITVEAKIAGSSGNGVLANLRVTYQIIDGINAIWPYEPETYKNVRLWPNPNEGYLARRIEELAYLHRKDSTFWQRITDPNPFKYFVCDGIYSELLGADVIEPGKTYKVTVTLDTRLLSGHHNISESYDPSQLNFLSSLNSAVETWWDQQMTRQEVHYKKAKQAVNDFWSSLFAKDKETLTQDNSPTNDNNVNNGKTQQIIKEDTAGGTTSLKEFLETGKVVINGKEIFPGYGAIPKLIGKGGIEQISLPDYNLKDFIEGVEGATETIKGFVVQGGQEFIEDTKELIDRGQERIEKVIDYIESPDSLSSKLKENIQDGADAFNRLGDALIDGVKKGAEDFGRIFKIPRNFDALEDEIATTVNDVLQSDKAIDNTLSQRLSSEFTRSLMLANNSSNLTNTAGVASYMAQLSDYLYEVAQFIIYIQQLGYYDFMRDYRYLSNSENFYTTFEEVYSSQEFINRLLSGIYREAITSKLIMALPGEVPDNNDLILTNYYLYDPSLPGQDDIDTLVYDYVGNDALSYYIYDYDDYCQKVRGIESKEKNYLSFLSEINSKFECWSKYELAHYTEEENSQLPIMYYDQAHTPGEVKMTERLVWTNEQDDTDIFFDPINILNSHISDKQNEIISALTQFNPRDYWEERKDYVEWDGHSFESGVDYYIETPTGTFKKTNETIPNGSTQYYIKQENGNEEAAENFEKAEDITYLKNIMMVPIKTVYFKQFTGDLNYAGFKYGINLKSIKRTLDSKELVSRLIVKENTNEHAMDGFCTIQRAPENPIKESFILNFDYYVQHNMLKREEVWKELYDTKDGYYVRLAKINKDLEDLVDRIAEINECLDRINANYETYSLARDAAMEEIEKMAIELKEYMPKGVPSPWKYNMANETEVLRTSWSETQTKQFTTTDKNGKVIEMTEHVVQGQTRAIEIPKYNADAQGKLKQMDIFQRNYEKYRGWAEKARQQKKTYEQKLKDLYAKSDKMYRMKNNLNLLFFKKYYRFIQEGSWKEDSYMDDTLYYLDALATARNSAFPKVTYDISVIDLQNLDDYKGYNFGIGDKTYVEDVEFFGYTTSDKPYQEEAVVTKIEYHLDESSKNKITITNYKTQFEDMFKRIAAAVSKVELGTGAYNRANAVINETGLGSTNTVLGTPSILENLNGTISIGQDGIITTESGNTSNKIRIVNGAVYRSTDGGTTYQKVITADGGIDPSMLGNGRLDLTSLTIGSKDNPELAFTANGLTAFRKQDNVVDYSTFVRFDSYGMYGIKNYKRNSSTTDSSNATLNDVFVPTNIDNIYENASYGLTWDGFFLKTGDGTGRVTIGTNQDLRMSIKDINNAWSDRLVIGKIQDGENEPYYGFRIIDNNENIVLNTDDKGQLYLRHKLYISHFNDEYGTISNDDSISIDKKLDQTNVTLGIVKAYKRNANGGYDRGEEVHDNYSSLEYLTKILSVKSVVDGYDLKGKLNNNKDYFRQFTQADIDTLIDSNENLAIFDNGNLYAKNAWIEGSIRATDGYFTGTVTAAKLQAVSFSKENISAVGGTIFIRPTISIIKMIDYNKEPNVLTILTDLNDKDDIDFLPGNICELSISNNTITFIITDISYLKDEKSQYNNNRILVLKQTHDYNINDITNDMIKNKPLISFGGLNYTISNNELISVKFGTYAKLVKNEINEEELKQYRAIFINCSENNNFLSYINLGSLKDKELSFILEDQNISYTDILQIIDNIDKNKIFFITYSFLY